MHTSIRSGLGIAEVIGAKRSEILRIAQQHNVGQVQVFGSVARAEATDRSDLDLLIDFGTKYRLSTHLALAAALESLLGRPVDIANIARLRSEYRDSILKDAVPL